MRRAAVRYANSSLTSRPGCIAPGEGVTADYSRPFPAPCPGRGWRELTLEAAYMPPPPASVPRAAPATCCAARELPRRAVDNARLSGSAIGPGLGFRPCCLSRLRRFLADLTNILVAICASSGDQRGKINAFLNDLDSRCYFFVSLAFFLFFI